MIGTQNGAGYSLRLGNDGVRKERINMT